jgi:hypothetical protein
MEDNQIVEKRKIYQAIGIISGMLVLTESQYSILTIGEHTYTVTVSRNVEEKHEPGQLQSFKVYPTIIEGQLGFSLREVIKKAPEKAVIFLKGCWTIYREEPRLIIYRNRKGSDAKTVLQLIWEEAPVPTVKRRYWEIEAELKGEKFEVIEAIGPFDPPRTSFRKTPRGIKSDVSRPTLKGAEPKAIKSELPSPTLKCAKDLIAPLAPKAIAPPESEPTIESTSESIAFVGSHGAIAETTIATKAAEVIEPIAASEIKAIAEIPSKSIEPEEPEASPVFAEPVTPKTKKASGKSSVSMKSSITPETAESKKTKEKVKSSSSKKPMSLAADRLFLGKQLPPGK